MIGSNTSPAACCNYELEIAIAAPAEKVWKAIFEDVNLWWLPDFHVTGPDSVVTFDPKTGGRGLVEDTADGGSLLWYSVQMFLPAKMSIYLFGHIAPEWGGPTTSYVKLAVEPQDTGCLLKISDSRHGNVDDKHVESYPDGWRQLFTDGLKAFVEKS
jgi:uncharacterized protein YndB with AHSA1/START domain